MARVKSKIASNIRGARIWYVHYEGCKKIYFIQSALIWHSGKHDPLRVDYLKSLGFETPEDAMEKALIYAKAIRYMHFETVLVS